MYYEPRFQSTAIGSVPFENPEEACRLMVGAFPEAPPWPQLPKRSFLENMYVQYSEGLPGIRIDRGNERIWFQTDEGLDEELEPFYQAVIEEDTDRFAISSEYAAGLDLFSSGKFESELADKSLVKGQVTGPVSFGLTVCDQDKRASMYNETLEQVIVKGLALKARWQCDRLREAAPNARVILFIDEPYLVSVGSPLVGVTHDQVVDDLTECVRNCGADITGMHCCGNTDWSLVFSTGVDIVNFDAFDYLEEFLAYDREIDVHIRQGGVIAWGLVPNDHRSMDAGPIQLTGMLENAFDALDARGLDRELLARRSIITPACGLGPATEWQARKAIRLTQEVSSELREKYF